MGEERGLHLPISPKACGLLEAGEPAPSGYVGATPPPLVSQETLVLGLGLELGLGLGLGSTALTLYRPSLSLYLPASRRRPT